MNFPRFAVRFHTAGGVHTVAPTRRLTRPQVTVRLEACDKSGQQIYYREITFYLLIRTQKACILH